MRKALEYRGNTPVIVEYLHEVPDPVPRPINSAYLLKNGWCQGKGNRYEMGERAIFYDGCIWWLDGKRVDSIEELEKLTA